MTRNRWIPVNVFEKNVRDKEKKMTFRSCVPKYRIHSLKDQINSKHHPMKWDLPSHLLNFVVSVNFSSFFLGDSSQYCLFEHYITQLLSIVAKEDGRDFPIDQRSFFSRSLSVQTCCFSHIHKHADASTLSASVQWPACVACLDVSIALYIPR